MGVTIAEPTVAPPQDREDTGTVEPGSPFGKCPVCQKPLRPRCRYTGEPKAPPVNAGWESRAKCGGCGTILVYLGSGKWGVWDGDLSGEDLEAEEMNRKLGF